MSNLGALLGAGGGFGATGQSLLQMQQLKRQAALDALAQALQQHNIQNQDAELQLRRQGFGLQQQEFGLREKEFAERESGDRAREALSAWQQTPGLTPVTPADWQKNFAGTPAGAVGFDPPTPGSQDPTLEPGGEGPVLPAQPNYISREPLAQYRAMSPVAVANIRDARSASNAQLRADTLSKNAAARDEVIRRGQDLRMQLGQQVNATRRIALQQALAGEQRKQQALELMAQRIQGELALGASRVATSPGATQQQQLSRVGLGAAPDLYDPADDLAEIDRIMSETPSIGGPFQAGTPAAPQPKAAPQKKSDFKILSSEPVK